jgi:hypothetical protein
MFQRRILQSNLPARVSFSCGGRSEVLDAEGFAELEIFALLPVAAGILHAVDASSGRR